MGVGVGVARVCNFSVLAGAEYWIIVIPPVRNQSGHMGVGGGLKTQDVVSGWR